MTVGDILPAGCTVADACLQQVNVKKSSLEIMSWYQALVSAIVARRSGAIWQSFANLAAFASAFAGAAFAALAA